MVNPVATAVSQNPFIKSLCISLDAVVVKAIVSDKSSGEAAKDVRKNEVRPAVFGSECKGAGGSS
jgi:hypothetical protein